MIGIFIYSSHYSSILFNMIIQYYLTLFNIIYILWLEVRNLKLRISYFTVEWIPTECTESFGKQNRDADEFQEPRSVKVEKELMATFNSFERTWE